MKLNGFELILASGSPRRQAFFKEIGLPFRVETHQVDEDYPEHLQGVAIAEHITALKAAPFRKKIQPNQLVITADTIVWHENQCLGKPKDKEDAHQMLSSLSGKEHQVITAVGFLYGQNWQCIHAVTSVRFKQLSAETIENYVNSNDPMDKAGAYGIQDRLGTIGIESIKGSYTNVVGLPVAQVVDKIKEIVEG